jgi:hypothetical protein
MFQLTPYYIIDQYLKDLYDAIYCMLCSWFLGFECRFLPVLYKMSYSTCVPVLDSIPCLSVVLAYQWISSTHNYSSSAGLVLSAKFTLYSA